MNKQELIKKYKELWNEHSPFHEPVPYTSMVELFLKELKQLDEPEKVKVPQFMADWISFVKTNGLKFKNTYGFYEEIAPSDDVYRVMYYIFKESIADKGIRKWVADNIDTFARAWLDGYEVEETKYVVTDGNHLYFKGYQEDVEIVILADEQPGTMDYVKKFDTKEEAQKVADILGWKVQEVA